jgi:hypothetical protein
LTPLLARYGSRKIVGRISIDRTLTTQTPAATQLFHGGSFGVGSYVGTGGCGAGTFSKYSWFSISCTRESLAK